jgi:Fe-S-cluster containining protein
MTPPQNQPLPPFTCLQCGYCCKKHGRYAYAYVTRADIRRIAAHLKLTQKAFRERFTKTLSHGTVLKTVKNRCIFFQEGLGCQVHVVKPRQCATWPFWPGNIKNGRFIPAIRRFCKGCAASTTTETDLP